MILWIIWLLMDGLVDNIVFNDYLMDKRLKKEGMADKAIPFILLDNYYSHEPIA